METGNRAAHDADEHKRENVTRKGRAAIAEVLIDRRMFQHGVGDQHADYQQSDGPNLQKARKVVARTKQ